MTGIRKMQYSNQLSSWLISGPLARLHSTRAYPGITLASIPGLASAKADGIASGFRPVRIPDFKLRISNSGFQNQGFGFNGFKSECVRFSYDSVVIQL